MYLHRRMSWFEISDISGWNGQVLESDRDRQVDSALLPVEGRSAGYMAKSRTRVHTR